MNIVSQEKYRSVLLEAISDRLYKVSLELNELKGQSMSERRKELTQKQNLLEELQHNLNDS